MVKEKKLKPGSFILFFCILIKIKLLIFLIQVLLEGDSIIIAQNK